MKKIIKASISFILVLLLLSNSLKAQSLLTIGNETAIQKEKRLQWWSDARFGMFIHWGLYALPARHEWVKNYERLTNDDYQKYFDEFNPDHFEPKNGQKKQKLLA
jgi:alpha-L-fucosidase